MLLCRCAKKDFRVILVIINIFYVEEISMTSIVEYPYIKILAIPVQCARINTWRIVDDASLMQLVMWCNFSKREG